MIPVNRVRDFGKSIDALEIGNLIEVQTESYAQFLQADTRPEKRNPVGLESLFRETFPIDSYDGNMQLEYLGYELGRARYTTDECRELRLTYGAPLRIRVRLVRKDSPEIKEDTIYLGEIPIMIGGGEFIVNGAERVIVSQLHRSPGVDFTMETVEGNRPLHACRIIPERGSWVEVNVTRKDVLAIRIDQSTKFAATCFLRALDDKYGTDPAIIRNDLTISRERAGGNGQGERKHGRKHAQGQFHCRLLILKLNVRLFRGVPGLFQVVCPYFVRQ